jgi:hypothetical protein
VSKQFRVWLSWPMGDGVRGREEFVVTVEPNEDTEVACREALDGLIESCLETGWEEVEVKP